MILLSSYFCGMRRNNTEPLSDVLTNYMKAMGLDKKINEVRLVNSWEEVVGTTIAKSTTKIEIKDRILHVNVRSSVIKNELRLLKDGLVKALNDRTGEKTIADIRFW